MFLAFIIIWIPEDCWLDALGPEVVSLYALKKDFAIGTEYDFINPTTMRKNPILLINYSLMMVTNHINIKLVNKAKGI